MALLWSGRGITGESLRNLKTVIEPVVNWSIHTDIAVFILVSYTKGARVLSIVVPLTQPSALNDTRFLNGSQSLVFQHIDAGSVGEVPGVQPRHLFSNRNEAITTGNDEWT